MTSRQDEQRQQKLIAEFEELKETLRRSQEQREFETQADPYAVGAAADRWEPYAAAPVVARPSEPRGPEPFARADFVEPNLRAQRAAPQEPRPASDGDYAFRDIDPRQEPRQERDSQERRAETPRVSVAKRLGVPDAAELVPIRSSFHPGKDLATLGPAPQEDPPRNWLPILALIGLIATVGLGLAFRDDWKGRKLEAETTQASAPDQPTLVDPQEPGEPSLGAEDKAAADALIRDQSPVPETAQAPDEPREKGFPEQTATITPGSAPESRPQEISPVPAPPAAAPSDLTQPPATAPVGRFTPPKQAPAQTAQPPAEPAKPKPAPKAAERPRPPQAAKPIKVIAAPPAAEAKARPERIVVPPLPSEALPPPPPPAAAAQPASGGVDPLGFVKRTFNSVTGTVTSWGREVIGQP